MAPLAAALLPFQREGVAAGLRWRGRMLLGDEMGLGKTLQAIAIAAHFRSEWPLLVLCPTSLALAWCEELEKWCPFLKPGDINLVKGHHNEKMKTAPITILTYGLVTNGKEKEQIAALAREARFRVAICDEAHYLKSKDSLRTTLLTPILRGAARCLLLTGTPALSRPVELWTLLQCLELTGDGTLVPAWRNFTSFTDRFCDAKMKFFGRGGRQRDVSGSSNEGELHALLTTHCLLRRRKAAVLTQLPAKRRQRVVLQLDARDARPLRAIEDQLGKLDAAASDWDRRQNLSAQVVELGAAKAIRAAEYAIELLPSAGKLLYFGHHKSMLDAMEAAAAKAKVRCLRIDGSTPGAERQALVKTFQALPDTTDAIFVLSILAAGQGLTLTNAHTVVFGELRWVPGELLQAEDRAHRIGQQSAVNCHYCVAEGTVDEAMWRMLQRKVRSLGRTLDGAAAQLKAPQTQWRSASQGDGDDDADGDGPGGAEEAAAVAEEAAAEDALELVALRERRRREDAKLQKREAFRDLFASSRRGGPSGGGGGGGGGGAPPSGAQRRAARRRRLISTTR